MPAVSHEYHSTTPLNSFVFVGDAGRDRTVGFGDLVIVSPRYDPSVLAVSMLFSPGWIKPTASGEKRGTGDLLA